MPVSLAAPRQIPGAARSIRRDTAAAPVLPLVFGAGGAARSFRHQQHSKKEQHMIQQTNYKKLIKLIPDLSALDSDVMYKAEGYMDLGVDILFKGERHIHMALSHYYSQYGDMIADPDMELAVYPSVEMVYALTYQDSFGFQSVYPDYSMETGRWTKVYPRLQKQLDSFLRQWLMNIARQGYKRAG
jgi:uncharacterized protein YqiB (DUF1249 family)